MNRAVVITTINAETDAIKTFKSLLKKDNFVIVSDKKTPLNKHFLTIDNQLKLPFTIVNHLPYNHYSRKNIGYLKAISEGASCIYDTDDDNFPSENWNFAKNKTFFGQVIGGPKFINAYSQFTESNIWPRGFPLRQIRSINPLLRIESNVNVGVWQGLADNDPDVDAIYRLIYPEGLKFDNNPSVVINSGSYCPFNSQNTLWYKEALPYAYLPISVSFRFTDILRGYIAQRCLWEHNLHLGFTSPTVYQERNHHDLLKDFKDEIECYLNIESIVICLDELSLRNDFEYNLLTCYSTLLQNGYVKEQELLTLKCWINDIKELI